MQQGNHAEIIDQQPASLEIARIDQDILLKQSSMHCKNCSGVSRHNKQALTTRLLWQSAAYCSISTETHWEGTIASLQTLKLHKCCRIEE